MRLRVTRSTLLIVGLFVLPFSATPALAAVGDQLAKFKPPKSGDGRGIELKSGTTAYYSTIFSENKLFMMDLKTQADAGSLDTTLNAVEAGRTFGALTVNQATGAIYGASYSSTAGNIYSIDPTSGALTMIFDTRLTDLQLSGLDGLSVDSDGSFFVSGDGLGLTSTRVYRFTAAGVTIGDGGVTVPFGNSGIAVDGDDLWLIDIDNKTVHKYTKSVTDTGVSFVVDSEIKPEDAAVDNCSFTGKKALWVHSASTGGGGYVAAYEIGSSSNAGCPSGGGSGPGGSNPRLTDPGAPSKLKYRAPKGGFIYPGRRIRFQVPSTLDPNGTIFVYYWNWRDYTGFDPRRPALRQDIKLREPEKEKATTTHKFKCTGFYRPKVRVLDSFGNEKTVTLNKLLTVQFPKNTIKRHGSLRIGPELKARGRTAFVRLASVKLRKRGRTKIRSIEYRIDGKRVAKRKRTTFVKKKLKKGPHMLKIKARFKRPGGTKTVKACFQI